MRMKLLLLAAAVGVVLATGSLFLAQQPPPPPAEQPAPATRARVALVMKTLTSPFFVEMEKGARRAEAELGVELLVKTAAQETSIEQQIAIVDQVTRDKVDAIVIAPGDSYRLIPGLKKAQDAGIVIVNVDNVLDPQASAKAGLASVPFISVDNKAAVYKAVKMFAEAAREPTQAAIIEGIRSASNAEDRKQGALAAFAENRKISVVASESANWKIDDAYDVARNMFTQHPRIRILFCGNDMMALGAIRYLQESKNKSVTVIGYDALEEARQAIAEGWLAATVDQQAGQQGFMGVSYAVRMLKGERMPALTLLDTAVVVAPEPSRDKK